jgi:diguanylate cyclase (GGDEF)-like protein/PAS domain S-box-containing protein
MSLRDANPQLQARTSLSPVTSLVRADKLAPLAQHLTAALELSQSMDLMEDIPLGIAVYSIHARSFSYANWRFAKAYGITASEVVGKDAKDFMHPDAVEAAQPFVEELFRSGKTVMYVQPNSYAADAPWAQVIMVPKHDANKRIERVVVIISDITEQRRSEIALLEHRQRLLAFMQVSEEGIVIHKNGVILDVNSAMCRMVGYSEQELLGTEVLTYVVPAHRAKVVAHIQRASTTLYENRLLHKDGTEIVVEQMGRALSYKGEQVRMTIIRDARERMAAQERIHRLAHYDELTSLPNRFHLMQLLSDALERAHAARESCGLLFLDLDKFKRINDSLGHGAGDAALHEVANRLKSAVNPDDIVARFAGDEFVILIHNVTDREVLKAAAQRLMQSLSKPMQLDAYIVPLSTCIGVAIYPDHGATPKELIAHADSAVLVAKKQGPGTVQFYSTAMSDAAYQAIVMEQELHEALRREEFVVHYQPQVRGSDGKLIGFEALLRWQHPTRGLLMPSQFLLLAEDRQLMKLIGDWVMADVIKTLKRWIDAGYKPVPLSVNLSSQQLEAHDFVSGLAALLKRHELNASLLELELTENMLMHNMSLVRERMAQLQSMGVRVAIDDFGTGFSSLAHLKQFALDRLKIDQSFVRDLPDAADSVAITKAIVQMAHSLGMSVIAEGVESEVQKQYLLSIGCDELQGYLFGKAESIDKAEILLRGL